MKRIMFGLFAVVFLFLLPAVLFGSGKTESTGKTEPQAAAAEEKEAPALAKLVAEGKLPPLEERLPDEPLVVEPYEEIGRYGGEINTYRSQSWQGREASDFSDDALLGWNLAGSQLMPNVAKAYEISNGGRTFTFFLRKGHKWSDGQPFTAEDIRFWWEDIQNNKEIFPSLIGTW
jgi:peptide/nickel transport system substrate-binding protein